MEEFFDTIWLYLSIGGIQTQQNKKQEEQMHPSEWVSCGLKTWGISPI